MHVSTEGGQDANRGWVPAGHRALRGAICGEDSFDLVGGRCHLVKDTTFVTVMEEGPECRAAEPGKEILPPLAVLNV